MRLNKLGVVLLAVVVGNFLTCRDVFNSVNHYAVVVVHRLCVWLARVVNVARGVPPWRAINGRPTRYLEEVLPSLLVCLRGWEANARVLNDKRALLNGIHGEEAKTCTRRRASYFYVGSNNEIQLGHVTHSTAAGTALKACYPLRMNPDWEPDAYDYEYPEALIAHEPVFPRDSAKLLVYRRDTQQIMHAKFKDLAQFLEPGSLIVMNDTRVIAARFVARKETGGEVRILFLKEKDGVMEALADRSLTIGSHVLTGNAKKIEVIGKEGSVYLLKPEFENIPAFLEEHGRMPLPPYIHSPLSEQGRREEYQTIFAKNDGSAAAPTASLHFTEELMEKLKTKGINIAYVTLHVGLGTFAPLSDEAIESGTLHSEWYDVPEETAAIIRAAKAAGKPVIAVGTTVTRALESAAAGGELQAGSGETSMFIRPGYEFQVVNQLVTNFHVPRSSLMQLVASLTEREELLRIYDEAIENRYRLFSFGDGMLVL